MCVARNQATFGLSPTAEKSCMLLHTRFCCAPHTIPLLSHFAFRSVPRSRPLALHTDGIFIEKSSSSAVVGVGSTETYDCNVQQSPSATMSAN
jgi:hypothetical protein